MVITASQYKKLGKKHKYNAQKIRNDEGLVFDSKLEKYCYDRLKASNIAFEFQVAYDILPKSKRSIDSIAFIAKLNVPERTIKQKNGKCKKKKIVQSQKTFREIKHIVDFVILREDYCIIIDTKGFITTDYRLKNKMLVHKLEQELDIPFCIANPSSKKEVDLLVNFICKNLI